MKSKTLEAQNIVLLGDSIFDNASYVDKDQHVTAHLRRVVPENWNVTLSAVDGAKIVNIPDQLKKIPDNATKLVLSVGGNDLLQHIDFIGDRALSAEQFVNIFTGILENFLNDYGKMITDIMKLDLPLSICTIYNGDLEDMIKKPAQFVLSAFNDAIYRIANNNQTPVIELRTICTEPADYSNSIEPSSIGGKKIAIAISESII